MRNAYLIVFLYIIPHVIGQSPGKIKCDTTVSTENCVKSTIVKCGSSTSTRKEFLDCFGKDKNCDTIITVKGCEQKVAINCNGEKLVYTKKLECFWDDAEVIKEEFLIYSETTTKCYFSYKTTWKKDGLSKSQKRRGSLSRKETYRLGFDTLSKDTIFPDAQLLKRIALMEKNPDSIYSSRDTSLNRITVLKAVNKLRVKGCQCGDKKMLPAKKLKWNKDLEKVAFHHAKDMYLRKYFSHDSPDGNGPGYRMKLYDLHAVWGENIAAGNATASDAVDAWERSPGHCINMMNKNYIFVGVARYMDKYCMVLCSSIYNK